MDIGLGVQWNEQTLHSRRSPLGIEVSSLSPTQARVTLVAGCHLRKARVSPSLVVLSVGAGGRRCHTGPAKANKPRKLRPMGGLYWSLQRRSWSRGCWERLVVGPDAGGLGSARHCPLELPSFASPSHVGFPPSNLPVVGFYGPLCGQWAAPIRSAGR